MKRLIPILCFAMLLSGCGKDDKISTEKTFFTEGRFLQSNVDTALIIIENQGPCTMYSDNEEMFAGFTDGDLIEIEFDGDIAETYPAQIGTIYSAKLKEDGEITDIDQNVIEDLKSMGWIE